MYKKKKREKADNNAKEDKLRLMTKYNERKLYTHTHTHTHTRKQESFDLFLECMSLFIHCVHARVSLTSSLVVAAWVFSRTAWYLSLLCLRNALKYLDRMDMILGRLWSDSIAPCTPTRLEDHWECRDSCSTSRRHECAAISAWCRNRRRSFHRRRETSSLFLPDNH